MHLLPAVVAQIALVVAYVVLRPTGDDFGRVTSPLLRAYLLVTALAAVVSLWVAVVRVPRPVCVGALTAYLIGQIFFLPLVRIATRHGGSRVWAQALLAACVGPVAVLFAAVIGQGTVATAAAGYALFHVAVHDAVVYGSLF